MSIVLGHLFEVMDRQQTIRQANKCIVEARVRRQCRRLSRGRIGSHQGPGLERVYADLILRIDTDELVGTELEKLGRCLTRELEDDRNAPLAKDIDLAASELSITGADREERLNGVVCDSTNLRVHTTARKLHEESVSFPIAKKGCLERQDERRRAGINPGTIPRTDPSGFQLACLSEDGPFPAREWWQAMKAGGKSKGTVDLSAECSQLTTWRRG